MRECKTGYTVSDFSHWARNIGLVVGFGELCNGSSVSEKHVEFHDCQCLCNFIGRTLLHGSMDLVRQLVYEVAGGRVTRLHDEWSAVRNPARANIFLSPTYPD